MSIYTALRAGVSGLSANSSALAVISDNIANVNTVGYKRGAVDFSALVNAQNSRTTYNAGGVLPKTRTMVTLQGSLEQSRSPIDFAISGEGFFIVSENNQQLTNGGKVLFTRAGSFTIDAKGFMVNAQGMFLQGWPVGSDGAVSSSPTSLSAIEPINVASVGGLAEPTENVGINANLNSDQVEAAEDDPLTPLIDEGYNAGDMALGNIGPHFETSLEIYDSLGAARTVAFAFLKTGPNEWQVEAYARPATNINGGAATGGLLAVGVINFNTNGTVNTVTGTIGAAFPIDWDASLGADNTQEVTIDLSTSLTQNANSFGVTTVLVDGVPPGDLVGLILEDDGFLTAQFSNGRSRSLYQIPVATFLNPNGLQADVGGTFRNTLESGLYNINKASAGGAGSIESGVLEGSNVDLASEFTNLITTQRAYSAASRIITTADQMLEELINIKR